MEVLGRLPLNVYPPIVDVERQGELLQHWRAGRIVTRSGRLHQIERRWFPYKASRLRAWWDQNRRPARGDQCELYFHQVLGNADFLVVGYVKSRIQTTVATLYCAGLVLDEIARIKGCSAIVAELNNDRLSNRLMHRWGWVNHCANWGGRHFIKRFYGNYPKIPPVWEERMRNNTQTL
jgi:hypothetical protein